MADSETESSDKSLQMAGCVMVSTTKNMKYFMLCVTQEEKNDNVHSCFYLNDRVFIGCN